MWNVPTERAQIKVIDCQQYERNIWLICLKMSYLYSSKEKGLNLNSQFFFATYLISFVVSASSWCVPVLLDCSASLAGSQIVVVFTIAAVESWSTALDFVSDTSTASAITTTASLATSSASTTSVTTTSATSKSSWGCLILFILLDNIIERHFFKVKVNFHFFLWFLNLINNSTIFMS